MTQQTAKGLGDRFVSLTKGGPSPGPKQIALVPGAEVPVLALDLPAGLRGQSREQVARRQLLDRAGLDSETEMRPLHPPKEADNWSRVMVINSAQLEGWKALAGTSCRAVLPDYLALPASRDVWTLTSQEGTVLARLGPDDGFAAPNPVAEAMLSLHMDRADTPPKAIWLQDPKLTEIAALARAHDIPIVQDALDLRPLKLAEPKVLGHGELSFDLRRDPQLARARLSRRVLPWRWPLLLGALATGLWAATQIIETRRITEQTTSLQAQTRALVREHFVPSGPLLDMRIQVSQVLAERRLAASNWRSEVTALDLFATAAGVLTQNAAKTETAVSVGDQELALTVTVADFAAVDTLAAALREAGLSVNVLESRVTEGSSDVRTDLRLSPPAPEADQ